MLVLAHGVIDSPVGPLAIEATDMGLRSIAFHGARRDGAYGGDAPRFLSQTVEQLESYFEGSLRTFHLPLDLSELSPFRRAVLEVLAGVPYAELVSYGWLAREIPTAPRAVGQAVAVNPIPIVIPCHRVIAADGSLGGFSSGLDIKRKLLALEGHGALSGGWVGRRAPRPERAIGAERDAFALSS